MSSNNGKRRRRQAASDPTDAAARAGAQGPSHPADRRDRIPRQGVSRAAAAMASRDRARLPADSRRPAQQSRPLSSRDSRFAGDGAAARTSRRRASIATSKRKIVVVPGDITNQGLLGDDAKPFKRGSLDAVVHCAGLVNFEASLEKAIEVNTIGVANVIEFCRKSRRRDDARVDLLRRRHRRRPSLRRRHPARTGAPIRASRFNLEREIRDALAAVERVEAESRDQLRHAEFRGDEDDDSNPRESARRASAQAMGRGAPQGRRPQARAELGMAQHVQLHQEPRRAVGVRRIATTLDVTVVRPAVIESALRDPFPGWNQGVNTSAPLTYLAGRGYRFYPAKAELVLDVIPVDLAAHAMIPILAALLSRKHKPIYQLCTSDRNPLPMRRLVELTALSNRREHRKDGGTMAQARAASRGRRRLAKYLRPRQRHASASAQASGGVRPQRAGRGKSARAKDSKAAIDKFTENIDLARELVEVYRPYIQELVYTFHARQYSRALRDAQTGRRRASSVSSRPDRLARLLDQRSSAGTAPPYFPAARSAHHAAGPNRCRAIGAWSTCSIAPPTATARASR